MARIRTIKPEFWSNEKVMNCTRNSRLLFIGMWNFVDDAGRCADAEKTLKAQIFPGDLDVCSTMVRGMIDELSSNGLLQKYVVDGRAYLQVTGWDHQKIDRPRPSKCPAPDSTNDRRGLATDLILSNPTISNLKSVDSVSANSLASALPSGALASSPNVEASGGKEVWRQGGPTAVGRPALEAMIAAKRKTG
jgi:hypothetical protein